MLAARYKITFEVFSLFFYLTTNCLILYVHLRLVLLRLIFVMLSLTTYNVVDFYQELGFIDLTTTLIIKYNKIFLREYYSKYIVNGYWISRDNFFWHDRMINVM